MNFDDLRAAAEHPELSPRFVEGVMERIAKRQKRELLRSSVLLSGALLLFSYTLSVLVVDILASETLSFLHLLIIEPSILALQEGWFAVWESIPVFSLLATCIVAYFCFVLARTFIRTISFPFLHHAT